MSARSNGKGEILISFSHSSSTNFKAALGLAKRLPGYASEGEGRTERHSVAVPIAPAEGKVIADLIRLIECVYSWKSTDIRVDGRPPEGAWSIKESLARVMRCHQTRKKVPIGEDYCLGRSAPNDERSQFGCRFERGVIYEDHGYDRGTIASWYQFGSLSEDLRSFTVDKHAVMATIRANTEGHTTLMCPEFSWDRIEKGVSELPETIDLEKNDEFELKRSDLDPTKALGIQKKRRPSGLCMTVGFGLEGEEETILRRDVPLVKYSDVAAQDEALHEIENVVGLPLKHSEYFLDVGVTPHTGVILYGPPGNGKTLIAKAVASEADAHLEIINGPEVLSKWVGESESRLRDVFTRARRLAPSVVLIDELDSFAAARDEMTQQYQVSLISQLLVLLDGIESRGRVAVVATTNRIEAVDDALKRPGRFDYHIYVPKPSRAGRVAILSVHLRQMRASSEIDLDALADMTPGFSGADLAGLSREAGLLAIRRGLACALPATQVIVSMEDFGYAVDAIQGKRSKPRQGS